MSFPSNTKISQAVSLKGMDWKSILLAVSYILLIYTAPIQYAIKSLTGIRLQLDMFSLVVAPIILFAMKDYITRLLDSINIYVVIFICVLLLSSLWSRSDTAKDTYFLHAITIIPLSYALGLCLAQGSLLHLSVLSILLGIPVYLFLNPDFSDYDSNIDVVASYQTYSNFYLLVAFSCILLLFFTKNNILRILCLVLFAIFIVAMAQTGGRGGILALGLMAGALIYFQFPKKRMMIVSIGAGVALFAYSVFDSFIYFAYDYASQNKLFSIERLLGKIIFPVESDAVFSREALASAAVEVWKANPFFGAGLGGYPINANLGDNAGLYPHNLLLEILSEQGIFGFLVFAGLILKVFLRHMEVKDKEERVRQFFIVGMCVLAASKAMTSGHTETDTGFWVLLGYIVGNSWVVYDKQASQQRAAARAAYRNQVPALQ